MTRYIFSYDSAANDSHPTFEPDYSDEIALAHNPAALIDYLDALLANSRLTATSKARIALIIADLPLDGATRVKDLERRVEVAVLLVMTSPEYLIQR